MNKKSLNILRAAMELQVDYIHGPGAESPFQNFIEGLIELLVAGPMANHSHLEAQNLQGLGAEGTIKLLSKMFPDWQWEVSTEKVEARKWGEGPDGVLCFQVGTERQWIVARK